YRHPDHIAVHNATVRAFQAAGDAARYPEAGPAYQPQKLYFVYTSRTLLRVGVRLLPLLGRDPRRFGTSHDGDLVSLTEVDYPVPAGSGIPPEAGRAKAAASACHRSQLEGMPEDSGLIGLVMRLWQREETFTRAEPPVPEGQKLRETDLFEGLE